MARSHASQTLTTGPQVADLASIAVGADDTPYGRSALLWAAKHAWLVRARLDVTVAPDGDAGGEVIEEVRRAFPSLPVSVHVRMDVVDALIAAGRTADLVVLGRHNTRQHGIGPSATVASVAERADSDVVVVGGKPDAILGGYQRIAVLLAEHTMERAVRGAASMALPRMTPIRLVLPIPPVYVNRVAPDPVGRRRVLDEAASMVRRLSPLIEVSTELLSSAKPHEAVARLADTDVLVVGADGPLDALARAALHHARCPVFVAHRDRTVAPVPA